MPIYIQFFCLATNYIVHIDQENKVLNARVAALEAQLTNLRRANERLAMTVTHHTGQVPTQEELGILQTGYDEQRTPMEGRPLSPPPDVQPQVATSQAMPQHAHQQQQEHLGAHQQHQHQHQPQLHQPHPQQPHQMYQHRNDSTASASGSEY